MSAPCPICGETDGHSDAVWHSEGAMKLGDLSMRLEGEDRELVADASWFIEVLAKRGINTIEDADFFQEIKGVGRG